MFLLELFVRDPSASSGNSRPSPGKIYSRLNGGLLAGNHFSQYLSDRIKLGGINKWVGAGVEKCYDLCCIVAAIIEIQCWKQLSGSKDIIDIVRQPTNGEECTDKDHGLNDVGLNLT